MLARQEKLTRCLALLSKEIWVVKWEGGIKIYIIDWDIKIPDWWIGYRSWGWYYLRGEFRLWGLHILVTYSKAVHMAWWHWEVVGFRCCRRYKCWRKATQEVVFHHGLGENVVFLVFIPEWCTWEGKGWENVVLGAQVLVFNLNNVWSKVNKYLLCWLWFLLTLLLLLTMILALFWAIIFWGRRCHGWRRGLVTCMSPSIGHFKNWMVLIWSLHLLRGQTALGMAVSASVVSSAIYHANYC